MHVHLIINLVPLVALTLCLTAIQAGVWRARPQWTYAGLGIVAAAALSTPAVVVSGSAAKDIAVGALGVPASRVEFHQRRAIAIFALLCVAALISYYTRHSSRHRRSSSKLASSVAALSTVCIGMLIWTARHGGGISVSQ